MALPNALVILGGPHASAFGGKMLENTYADAVVPGEGEIAFEKIIQAHLEHTGFSDIPGISYRDKNREIVDFFVGKERFK